MNSHDFCCKHVDIWRLVGYFREFFENRRQSGQVVEKADSVYMDPGISDEEILRNILIYPFKRFEDIGVVIYNKQNSQINVDAAVWSSLSAEEKSEIKDTCDRKLEEYFSTL